MEMSNGDGDESVRVVDVVVTKDAAALRTHLEKLVTESRK